MKEKPLFRGAARSVTIGADRYLVNRWGCVWVERAQKDGGYWCIGGTWYDVPRLEQQEQAIQLARGQS